MIVVFVRTVLPLGAVFVAMLASGSTALMRVASVVLATPVRIGSLQLSIPVFMTALCSILSLCFYTSLNRQEARAAQTQSSVAEALAMQDRQQMMAAFAGRNFYISLLGLTLWVVAWRLKALHDQQRLLPRAPAARRPMPATTRLLYVVMGIVAFLMADVPICRINYNVQLYMFVTVRKASLQRHAEGCEAVYLARASETSEACSDFCDQVRMLSEERSSIIASARDWHVLGRVAARIFDGARGVEQGEVRLAKLFETKTCAQVLESVDKSNWRVNVLCLFFATVAIMGAWSAFSDAYEDHQRLHED